MHKKVLPNQIEMLLANYGISGAKRQHIFTTDFDIYRIETTDQHDGRSLRVYADEAIHVEDIRSEIEWLLALKDHGLHVPKPLSDGSGQYIHTLATENGGFRYGVLLTWLSGRFFDKGLTPQRLYRVGFLTGNLHTISERLTKVGHLQTKRLAFDIDFEAWKDGRRTKSMSLSRSMDEVIRCAADKVQAELSALTTDATHYGFIHSDLHQWNYLFLGREAGAIDFGDCGWGHYALDLATVLQYLKYPIAGNWDHRFQYDKLKDALLLGYAEAKCLPPAVEDQIDIYIIARMLYALEWILDDWPQVDYLPWGPRFLNQSEVVFKEYLS